MMRTALLLAIAVAIAAPAHGEEQSSYRLYADGQYEQAIKAGLTENDAPGFSAAARAALAEEASRDQPCLECLQKAESYARRAIAANPKLADGHVYLAISLGLESRIVGPVVARLNDYPGQAKNALDAALGADPKNAWALAALGGWNIEVVRNAGRSLANWLYDASLEKGFDLFQEAFKAAPENVTVRYQYALSLSNYDSVHYRDQIAEALNQAAYGKTETVYGHLVQKRAGELLDLLKNGTRAVYMARVRKFEGYP
jgi:hypothetical protein